MQNTNKINKFINASKFKPSSVQLRFLNSRIQRMLNDEAIQALQCAISSEPHFVRKPLGLSCGHSICKTCVPKSIDNPQIRCKLCGEINRIKLDELNESKAVKQLIKVHFNELLTIVENRFDTTLSHLKDSVTGIRDRISMQVEAIKEEVDNRVKTLKHELDILNDVIRTQLDKSKVELLNAAEIDKINLNDYEQYLHDLRVEIKKQQYKNETTFYECQDKIEEMNTELRDLHNFNNEVSFRASKINLDSDIIGQVFYNYRSLGHVKDLSILNRLKSGKYKLISTKTRPSDICVLSNGMILAANSKDYNLTLYDQNIKAIKTVDRINYQQFQPISLATRGDRIYICDIGNHRIIRTDLEFRRNGLFGSQGYGLNQLNHPHGICYNKQFLYVCDSYNNRIVKLTSQLYFVTSYPLDYEPWQIKITNNIACIRALNVSSIFFYDISAGLTFKYEFTGHNGIIGEVGSCFYEYFSYNRKIYFYDSKGELYDEVETDGFGNIKVDAFGGIASIGGKLILSFEDSRKIAFV